jgi:hypothetical protein
VRPLLQFRIESKIWVHALNANAAERSPNVCAAWSPKISGERKPKAEISLLLDLGASHEATDAVRDKDKMIGEALWTDNRRKVKHKTSAAGAAQQTEHGSPVSVFVDTSV